MMAIGVLGDYLVKKDSYFHYIFMSSLCGVGVRVRVNNFFSKTTRPRDMLFFLKIPYLSRMKNVQGMQICLFVCLLETLQGGYPHQKCENFNFLSQFSQ